MANTLTIAIYVINFIIASCYSEVSIHENNKNIFKHLNITTLYPVNVTIEDIKIQQQQNKSNHNSNAIVDLIQEARENSEESKEVVTISNSPEKQVYDRDTSDKERTERTVTKEKENVEVDIHKPKNYLTTWTIKTNYSELNYDKDNSSYGVTSDSNSNEKTKEFRPSPHLSSFFEEQEFSIPTHASYDSYGSIIKKPSTAYVSSLEDYYKHMDKKPYMHITNNVQKPTFWKHATGLESKPTMAVPVKIPAGVLYNTRDVFIRKPNGEVEGPLGAHFKDEPKEYPVEKRVNPWRGFLQLATALLPVGLIISALTPNVITLQSSDDIPQSPSRFVREVDSARHLPPAISEPCKRRLLCEIHSDSRPGHRVTSPGYKRCHKLYCEDTDSMLKVVRWLLSLRSSGHGLVYGQRNFI